ncbi:MAG: histidine kinase, partial [Cyclobacteriaceae bacterium]
MFISRIRKIRFLPLLLLILVVAVVFLVLYFTNAVPSQYYTVGWITLVIVVVWAGNAGLTVLLDRWITWLQYGNIRFFAQLILGIVFTLLVINGTYFLLKYFLTQDPPTSGQLIVTNAFGAMIFLPAYCIYFSLNFLRYWRSSELEAERYQKESIRSQLESLKNHLDPHFLFNNLNVLSSLIDKDRELSKQFLNNFGEVYRSMLRTRSDDLITLHDELDFIDSYFFLIKVRFGEDISIELKVDEEVKNLKLPPLTLQMLVENAFKHNNITEKRPLQISILNNGRAITVTNSLFEKPSEVNGETG